MSRPSRPHVLPPAAAPASRRRSPSAGARAPSSVLTLAVTAVAGLQVLAQSPLPSVQALTVMSAGALEPALVRLAGRYERSAGRPVRIQFGTAPQLASRLAAGDRADILIAPTGVVAQAVEESRAIGRTRTVVGRVGVALAVRRDAWRPDVGSVESLRRALLEADALVFNRASTGLYIEQLLARLDLADRLRPKIVRYASGAEVLDHVLRGSGRDLGFGALTEIREYEPRGLVLVGPLPGDVQHSTTYEAVVMAGTAHFEMAEAFIAYLATPDARQVLAETGVQ